MIQTNPPGARLWVGGSYAGRAPVRVVLQDGPLESNRTNVRAELEGHQTVHATLEQVPAAGYIVLDSFAVLATLGLAAPLYVLNASRHRDSYTIQLQPTQEPAVFGVPLDPGALPRTTPPVVPANNNAESTSSP